MTHEFNVKYLDKTVILTAKILVTQITNGENLLEYSDRDGIWQDKDAHLFSSFCKLRKYLEGKGKILLCKGCRRNVHPAGFQIAWMYALVLTKGMPFDKAKDEVLIFDEELEIDQLVSVEEQDKFYRDWWNSVNEKRFHI